MYFAQGTLYFHLSQVELMANDALPSLTLMWTLVHLDHLLPSIMRIISIELAISEDHRIRQCYDKQPHPFSVFLEFHHMDFFGDFMYTNSIVCINCMSVEI